MRELRNSVVRLADDKGLLRIGIDVIAPEESRRDMDFKPENRQWQSTSSAVAMMASRVV